MMRNVKRALVFFVFVFLLPKIVFEFRGLLFEERMEEVMEKVSVNGVQDEVAHKSLQIDGAKIHYYVSGKNKENPIVFLHPAFSDHRAFDLQVDFFAKEHKVIVVDLIGHGLSDRLESTDTIAASSLHIAQILEIEKIASTHLVGVSLGSLIAQQFGLQYPNKTKSLTALGGYNINRRNAEVEKSQFGAVFGIALRALFSLKAFRRKTAELGCYSEAGQSLLYASSSHFKRRSFAAMQGMASIVKDRPDATSDYPLLIMTGEFDIELATKVSKRFHAEQKQSEYYMVKNAGHVANLDEPEQFNAKLKAFIDAQP